MSPRKYVAVAARLFSIWLALASARAATLGVAASSANAAMASSVPFFIAVLFLAMAALLWFFPLFVAGSLVPDQTQDEKDQITPKGALEAACIVLGLYVIVVDSLPSLTSWLTYAAIYVASGQAASNMGEDRNVDGLISFVQLVAGVLLIRNARRWSSALIA